MSHDQTKVFARPDTFFGVCEAIGQDLGFNPTYLRIALGSLVLWSLTAPFVIYAFLGVAVLISRVLFPVPKRTTMAATPAAPQSGENDEQRVLLPLAA